MDTKQSVDFTVQCGITKLFCKSITGNIILEYLFYKTKKASRKLNIQVQNSFERNYELSISTAFKHQSIFYQGRLSKQTTTKKNIKLSNKIRVLTI